MLGGREWPVLFTHGALLDLELATGLDVIGGGLDVANPTARSLRDMLLCGVRQGNDAPTEPHLLAAFRLNRIVATRRVIWDAWIASMPEAEPEECGKDRKPAKPLTWIEAWAIADQDLGLAAEEWLGMTPRMLHALNVRHLEQLRQWELMCGMIIANNANFSACAPEKALAPARFMLHPWPEEKKADVPIGQIMMKEFAKLKGGGR